MTDGVVAGLFTAGGAGEDMRENEQVTLVTGVGIDGDRYASGSGKWSQTPATGRQVTLIEAEAIEAMRRDYNVEVRPADARRNILTRGVALNHLVGQEFTVGTARLRGVRLAEPCAYLASLTRPGVARGLVHRGGLRADVLEGAVVRLGDRVRPT